MVRLFINLKCMSKKLNRRLMEIWVKNPIARNDFIYQYHPAAKDNNYIESLFDLNKSKVCVK